MTEPLVSIHCITYNHAKFIKLCLYGFVMQKTNFPFEVLVHDDASTDGTQDIIKEFQQAFPEIIKPIYQTENQWQKGVYVSGLLCEKTRGKYVATCEGDDNWIDENKLQIQVDFMESHPECSVCFHPVLVSHENPSSNYIFPSKQQRHNKEVFELDDLLWSNFIQTNSVMYRWPFYGKKYEQFIPNGILPGDWYWHLFHAQFGSICFIDKIMAVYNRHAECMWNGEVKDFYLKHGIKHLKFYEAVYENIAPNKEEYMNRKLIPEMEKIYNVFKENNNGVGLNFVESDLYWTQNNRMKSISFMEKFPIKFLIYAPPYNSNSGGIIVLYKLYELLIKHGFNSEICIFSTEKDFLTFVNRKTIVVYPEITDGNPLNAKNIVRWLLYKPKALNPNANFTENELTFCYNKSFNDVDLNPEENILTISNTMRETYKQTNFEERNGRCYIIRKGEKRIDLPKSFDGPIIDGKSHEKIAKIFNECEYCISYDTATMYTNYARMCGCIPIVMPDNSSNAVQILNKFPWIAYGNSPEEISSSRESENALIEYLQLQEKNNDKQVLNFVDICRKRFNISE